MILAALILAVSFSLDAFGVGIAYGLRKVKIPFASKLIICVLSILYAGAAMLAGKSLSGVLTQSVSKWIGTIILIILGLYIVVQSLVKNDKDDQIDIPHSDAEKTLFKLIIKSLGITIQVIKNPARGDVDKSGVLDVPESIMLGLAISIDAIGGGIGCALAGLNSLLIPVLIGIFQLLFLYAGIFLGGRFSPSGRINKKIMEGMPGALLLLIAILNVVL